MRGTTEQVTRCLERLGMHESIEFRLGYGHLIEIVQMLPRVDDISLSQLRQCYEALAERHGVSSDAIRWRIRDYVITYYDFMYMPLAPSIMTADPDTGVLPISEFIRRLVRYLKSNEE